MEHRVKLREPVATTLPDISMQVDSWHRAGCERLVIDMATLQSIDSMAIGTLVRLGIRCKEVGLALILEGVSPFVRRSIEQAGVTHLLHIDGHEPPSYESTFPSV